MIFGENENIDPIEFANTLLRIVGTFYILDNDMDKLNNYQMEKVYILYN